MDRILPCVNLGGDCKSSHVTSEDGCGIRFRKRCSEENQSAASQRFHDSTIQRSNDPPIRRYNDRRRCNDATTTQRGTGLTRNSLATTLFSNVSCVVSQRCCCWPASTLSASAALVTVGVIGVVVGCGPAFFIGLPSQDQEVDQSCRVRKRLHAQPSSKGGQDQSNGQQWPCRFSGQAAAVAAFDEKRGRGTR